MKRIKIDKKERNKKSLIEYTKTVIFTLLAIMFFASIVLYDAASAAKLRMSSVMEQIIGNFKTQTINDLKEQERLYPNDYRINMKLAATYEEMNEFFKSEEEYKKALFKSPRNSGILYRYALFCVSRGRFDEGIVLIENITDSPDKDTVTKKFTFYQYAGDKLSEKGDYWNATKIYLIGVKYGKILGGIREYQFRQNLINAAILNADQEIENNNTEQARLVLEGVLKYYDSSEAKYKLALIDLNTDPKNATDIMLGLMATDPQLINYGLLYSALENLAKETTDANELAYYNLKMSKVKASAIENALYSNEIKVEDPKITETKGTFGKKIMSFYIKNISDNPISYVHLRVVMNFRNTKPVTKEISINMTEEGEGYASVLINNWEHLEKYHSGTQSTKVEIYGRKNPRFDWVLIEKLDIPSTTP